MKNLFGLCCLMAVVTACNKPNTKLKERISNADSIAINYFKGDGTMDTVVAVKILRDKKMMEQLCSLISEESADVNTKCGYDGSLHFFKENQVAQDIDFRMNDVQCMFFTFKQEGKLRATVLSPEAKQMLETIRK
jgi:hypothetical protein